ncbi:DUF4041 domain-containing protein [Marinifilum fragile]|uniref:DUF4041 domain-containing protein n=1 Tax=Marinifilum fragile TaxID=570161 RepID=UPI0006CF2A09|nr:DUF4041 domain-containing protein [Marinifilum fragile]
MDGLIYLLIVAFLVFLIVLNSKNNKLKKTEKERKELDQELTKLAGLHLEKQAELDRLIEKYAGIIDLDKAIDAKVKEFEIQESQKQKELDEIQIQIDAIIDSAKTEAKDIRKRANETFDNAQRQMKVILENANDRAEKIAGEALEAKRNADHYEASIKAMKNIIKGYGDEYLKPTYSILDKLADEYSHKEAGQELKKARERSKLMVKNDMAADCDYVENYRRTTAINFVIDAFNGKVDTILARVKHDNFGKLEQQVKDSFHLVNNNGKAFRNARIVQEYLSARLDELDWAVKTNVLQLEEREEQRRIKEAIREEERARREYEKAIKEAEKEERMIQKAMKEAQKKLEAASQEERLKFEQQLEELKQKLVEAEEKNQRALSMAQQTRRGHVYIISNIGSFGEDIFKIGLTRRLEPLDRVKELGDASVPFEFDVHAMISSEDAPALEKALHHKFRENQLNKVNPRKEFFRIGLKEIKEEIESQKIEAKWILKAEAREYRESIALANQKKLTEEIILN